MALIRLKNGAIDPETVKTAEVMKDTLSGWNIIVQFKNKTPNKHFRYKTEAEAREVLEKILNDGKTGNSTARFGR